MYTIGVFVSLCGPVGQAFPTFNVTPIADWLELFGCRVFFIICLFVCIASDLDYVVHPSERTRVISRVIGSSIVARLCLIVPSIAIFSPTVTAIGRY